jgi:hypothetical protein
MPSFQPDRDPNPKIRRPVPNQKVRFDEPVMAYGFFDENTFFAFLVSN